MISKKYEAIRFFLDLAKVKFDAQIEYLEEHTNSKGYSIEEIIAKEALYEDLILAQLGVKERPFGKEILLAYFELLKTETEIDVLWEILSSIGHNDNTLNDLQIEELSKSKTIKKNANKGKSSFCFTLCSKSKGN